MCQSLRFSHDIPGRNLDSRYLTNSLAVQPRSFLTDFGKRSRWSFGYLRSAVVIRARSRTLIANDMSLSRRARKYRVIFSRLRRAQAFLYAVARFTHRRSDRSRIARPRGLAAYDRRYARILSRLRLT